MSGTSIPTVLALGAITGVRSMAGLAALAMARGGEDRWPMMAAAVGEAIADKTPFIGNRTDTLPLVGRAAIGGVLGALVAAEQDDDAVRGALIGAITAVAAAQLAFHARTRLVRGVAGGLLEDALVLAVAGRHVAWHPV